MKGEVDDLKKEARKLQRKLDQIDFEMKKKKKMSFNNDDFLERQYDRVFDDYGDVTEKLREQEDIQEDVRRISEMVIDYPAGDEPSVLHTREGREIYDDIESTLQEYMTKKNKPPAVPQSVCPLKWTQANMRLLALVAFVRQDPCHLYV